MHDGPPTLRQYSGVESSNGSVADLDVRGVVRVRHLDAIAVSWSLDRVPVQVDGQIAGARRQGGPCTCEIAVESRVLRDHVAALDVVGHEWAHAVTQMAGANLAYENESGALDEAFSDWMGTAIEHSRNEFNWTIGERAEIVRDMANPRLYSPECNSTRQMQLANAMCRFR